MSERESDESSDLFARWLSLPYKRKVAVMQRFLEISGQSDAASEVFATSLKQTEIFEELKRQENWEDTEYQEVVANIGSIRELNEQELREESEYVVFGQDKIKLASKKYRERDEAWTAKLLDILIKGPKIWNRWRSEHPNAYIDLSGVSFRDKKISLAGMNLREANLGHVHFYGSSLAQADLSASYLYNATLQSTDVTEARLAGAYLSEADLNLADLTKADLRFADLSWAGMMMTKLDYADLRKADLSAAYIHDASFDGAKMSGCDLSNAILRGSTLINVDLSNATLDGANLVEADLSNAILRGCRVYGVSVWKSILEGAEQTNLIITPPEEPPITVDNLKVAQFIYLLLNNQEIRQVIDTITSKVVLILGRFTPERKAVLDAIREELRRHGWLPVLFDFDGPTSRDVNETVSTLAHMARFIIADITDAKSIPQELQTIVPHLPSVPVQPLLQSAATEYGMFEHYKRYPWVLPEYRYENQATLLASLHESVIAPAEEKAKELQSR